ncbi:MAG: hypothetical protein O2894_00655 [Planctomycetota bacterium]|nr:hypothetical protein [Planctomycetota bacterium]
MDRFPFRALLTASLAAALLCVAAAPLALAEGEDLEGAGIQWIDGWAAGQAKATEGGKLCFVYFGRKTPT